MKTLSRREIMKTLLAVPVAAMLPRISLGAPNVMTVNEAMRYLCDEVFTSPLQRRHELVCLAGRRDKKEFN
ncbi:hypothetical protein [Paraburkholderia sp.]|uniref:hypothetical protein n=1 Tax=Paraburkholderia sp. TaxID=1926495 RepID=UPI0025E9C895|nr:hypothetical protein [Paraburkholderia sp.]